MWRVRWGVRRSKYLYFSTKMFVSMKGLHYRTAVCVCVLRFFVHNIVRLHWPVKQSCVSAFSCSAVGHLAGLKVIWEAYDLIVKGHKRGTTAASSNESFHCLTLLRRSGLFGSSASSASGCFCSLSWNRRKYNTLEEMHTFPLRYSFHLLSVYSRECRQLWTSTHETETFVLNGHTCELEYKTDSSEQWQ